MADYLMQDNGDVLFQDDGISRIVLDTSPDLYDMGLNNIFPTIKVGSGQSRSESAT